MTQEDVLDQGLLIDAVIEGLPDPDIREGFLSAVKPDHL